MMPTDVLSIELLPPEHAAQTQREPRVEAHHRVRYRVGEEEWTTRRCLNLSKHGLFVSTSSQYEPGTVLSLELYDGLRWLRAQARVQWTRVISVGGLAPAGMGLQVLSRHFADATAWEALVDRELALLLVDAGVGLESDVRVTPIAPPWMEAPREGAEDRVPSRTQRADRAHVREAVMLVGMSCASIALLLVR